MDSQEKALEQEQNVEQNVTEVEATAPVEQPEETQEAVVVSENSENSEIQKTQRPQKPQSANSIKPRKKYWSVCVRLHKAKKHPKRKRSTI